MSLTKSLLAVVLVLAVLAGGVPDATPQEPIRIAYVDPLSGPFAATGENGLKQFRYAADQFNKAGGVLNRQVEIVPFDNKVSPQESLIQLKKVIGDGIQFLFQGNSSGVAHAISDAVLKHNERNPGNRVLYLNYSAVDPALTGEKCHFWHFRFDAHADMKMAALTDVIKANPKIKKIYIIGQDYSFGKAVAEAAVSMLGKKRPDIQIVGNELHPIGKVKDFSPYVQKILASGADAVITGNWGADMVNLAKAANDGGLKVPFYTYYAASDGVTAAIGAAGVDRIRLVHESHPGNPNAPKPLADYLTGYKKLHPNNDVNQPRIHTAFTMLMQAIKKAGTTDVDKVAAALEGMEFTTLSGDQVVMRREDHQLLMPVYISVHTNKGIKFDFDNSGFGLLLESRIETDKATLPVAGCTMQRPR
ncbi:MAG TPA: branched-chain amino acid ABC transporter substrate-binding protein [Candidatus Tectomicrobia bacterium]|nr:branched-chain amino acid ABC transporter substrate-binding protein [Candidatus Tectomicrobia bacterium]